MKKVYETCQIRSQDLSYEKIRFSFIETSESDESVHGGDIYGFFLANQKRFQQAIIQKGRFHSD